MTHAYHGDLKGIVLATTDAGICTEPAVSGPSTATRLWDDMDEIRGT